MTKPLLLTSKVRHITEKFATNIQDLSKFPYEQEVLLIPYSAFEVIHIREIKRDAGILTETVLRQCKSDIQIRAASLACCLPGH